MRNPPLIVYAGGFPLPDHRASALRAIANARLFSGLGLETMILGRFARAHDGRRACPDAVEEAVIEGIGCRNIERIGGFGARAYLASAGPVRAALEEADPARVLAVIAYNYPARGLRALLALSRRTGIPLVAECTEWAGVEGRNPVREVSRQIGARYRNGMLARRAGNVICATRHGAARLAAANTLVLPTVLHETAETPTAPAARVRFVYAGSPGWRLGKERIDRVIEALSSLGNHPREFTLELTLTRSEVLAGGGLRLAAAIERLGPRIVFHGWLGREPLGALLRRSDILVFARPTHRQSSRFGFPTKLAEAYRHGLPVLANDTGDIGRHVVEGRSGWLAPDDSVAALRDAFTRALETPPEALAAMKRAMLADNPFAPERYRDAATVFFDRIEAERSGRRAGCAA